MTLAQACSFNSIRWLDHIWASSCVSPADRRSGWSRFNWLRSDRVYYRWQFEESVTEAARCGHLNVISWLFVHFEGCKTTGKAMEEAVRNNHFAVLRLLYVLDRRYHGERDRHVLHRLNEVKRGLYDMQDAARNGRGDIVRWLFGNTSDGDSPHRLRLVVNQTLLQGDIDLLEWLRGRGCIFNPVKAAESEHAHVIRWLFAQGSFGSLTPATAMKTMAGTGDLDVVQWIAREYYRDDQPVWPKFWATSLDLACQRNHLSVVQWLLEDERGTGFVNSHPDAMHDAAVRGFLDLAKYLSTQNFGSITAKPMLYAASFGHAQVVQCLNDEFGSTVPLFLKQEEFFINHVEVATPMDGAAANGDLKMLELLHKITALGAESAKAGRKPWTTQAAKVAAAAGGHLDAVKWLYDHGSDGDTTEVMDHAAGGGHLDVVKWLHSHTDMGCTSKAMDMASSGGHIEVVRWLHEHRSEGCTARVMDEAACHGHLEVVKWLHGNRFEGCTEKGVSKTLEREHPAVAQWLLAHRPECTVPDSMTFQWTVRLGYLGLFRWLFERFPGEVAIENLMAEAARSGRFEIVLFLHSQTTERFDAATAAELAESCQHPINVWIRENYTLG